MFREIREIKKEEKNLKGYKQIRPEEILTIEELNNMVNEIFNQASEGV